MRIQSNDITGINVNISTGHAAGRKSNNETRQSIDGTALQARVDPIAAKKAEARKKAMKIVGDAFAGEMKIDDELNARRERVKSLQRDIGEANKSIAKIEEDRSSLRDMYGVDADSREEQDLKLLEKEIKSRMRDSDTVLSFEERKKIEEIKANGLSEYQQRSLEMFETETPFIATVNESKREIKIENQIITATELERLKSHPMADAQKQADAVLDEASKEIVGLIIEEAKDHVDEEADKAKEKAEAEREKEEELQKRIDAAREKRKENEELTEDILDGVSEVTSVENDVTAAQQKVKDMMNKMKLIEDDIKGAAVDKSL